MPLTPIPHRTAVADPAGLLSLAWLRWLTALVANVPLSGTGSPEGVVVANVGTLYTRTDGGASTTLYVKESGTNENGWIAK